MTTRRVYVKLGLRIDGSPMMLPIQVMGEKDRPSTLLIGLAGKSSSPQRILWLLWEKTRLLELKGKITVIPFLKSGKEYGFMDKMMMVSNVEMMIPRKVLDIIGEPDLKIMIVESLNCVPFTIASKNMVDELRNRLSTPLTILYENLPREDALLFFIPRILNEELERSIVNSIMEALRIRRVIGGEERFVPEERAVKVLYRLHLIEGRQEGFFESYYGVGEHVVEDSIIGILRNVFGDIISELKASVTGVVLYSASGTLVKIGEPAIILGEKVE